MMDLREQNEQLREEVTQLRQLLVPATRFPADWKLTRAEESILASLLSAPGGLRGLDALHAAASGFSPESDPKIVQVYISRLRRRLGPKGVLITTIRGRGYQLDQSSRQFLRSQAEAA